MNRSLAAKFLVTAMLVVAFLAVPITANAAPWEWATLTSEIWPQISQGSSGPYVRAAQNVTKYFFNIGTSYVADGSFGSITRSYVRDYQDYYDLQVDGIVGRATWREMQGELERVSALSQYYNLYQLGGRITNTRFFRYTWDTTQAWYTYKAEPGSTPGTWHFIVQ